MSAHDDLETALVALNDAITRLTHEPGDEGVTWEITAGPNGACNNPSGIWLRIDRRTTAVDTRY